MRRTIVGEKPLLGIGWSPDGAYIVCRAIEGYALRLLRASDQATIEF